MEFLKNDGQCLTKLQRKKNHKVFLVLKIGLLTEEIGKIGHFLQPQWLPCFPYNSLDVFANACRLLLVLPFVLNENLKALPWGCHPSDHKLPTVVITEKPQFLSPVTTPFKAWTLQFAAQQQSDKSMWCPLCNAQVTTGSIIRAGHACGIVVNTIYNFLSAATCKRLLLTYPRTYEPSWDARAVLFSLSSYFPVCTDVYFPCFWFALSASVEGPSFHPSAAASMTVRPWPLLDTVAR